jgi:hypothetical protein
MTASVAFVPVSYGPDRDRCALLSRSLDEFAPLVEHLIVVDRADRQLFRPLRATERPSWRPKTCCRSGCAGSTCGRSASVRTFGSRLVDDRFEDGSCNSWSSSHLPRKRPRTCLFTSIPMSFSCVRFELPRSSMEKDGCGCTRVGMRLMRRFRTTFSLASGGRKAAWDPTGRDSDGRLHHEFRPVEA